MPLSDTQLPKQKQSAYQRWELASLDETEEATNTQASPSISKLAQEMMIARDEGYQQGFNEGYEAGINQGLANGLAQGHADGLAESREQMETLKQKLSGLICQFNNDAIQARETTADQLLALSLDMTKALIKTALHVQPTLILPVIEQAIHQLPYLQFPATLSLNPTDIALVSEILGDNLKQQGWQLVSDETIEAGGCRLATTTNEIDATLSYRWQELQQALGQNTDWLLPAATS